MQRKRAIELANQKSTQDSVLRSTGKPVVPEPPKSVSDQKRPRGKNMKKQSLAVVNRNAGAEESHKNHNRAGQKQRKQVGPAFVPSSSDAYCSQGEESNGNGDGEIKPRVMPRYVTIGDDLAEVLDHDRLP